mmetsp:Transcript_543/g.1449  ORF Transcript_543/g.1449 Transcript_543/m.1449 type:complete len:259 (-) Transcript_543:1268-2044(-)
MQLLLQPCALPEATLLRLSELATRLAPLCLGFPRPLRGVGGLLCRCLQAALHGFGFDRGHGHVLFAATAQLHRLCASDGGLAAGLLVLRAGVRRGLDISRELRSEHLHLYFEPLGLGRGRLVSPLQLLEVLAEHTHLEIHGRLLSSQLAGAGVQVRVLLPKPLQTRVSMAGLGLGRRLCRRGLGSMFLREVRLVPRRLAPLLEASHLSVHLGARFPQHVCHGLPLLSVLARRRARLLAHGNGLARNSQLLAELGVLGA